MATSRLSVDDYISGGLMERITDFLDDLQNFNEASLLENYEDSTYMSPTYFTEADKDKLLAGTIRGETLRRKLNELFDKRARCDGEICSSHDLKPVYERFFGFSKDDMSKPWIRSARQSWAGWTTSSVVSDALPASSDVKKLSPRRSTKQRRGTERGGTPGRPA